MKRIIISLFICSIVAISNSHSGTNSYTPNSSFITAEKNIFAVAASPHGQLVVVGDGNKIKFFDVKTKRLVSEPAVPHQNTIMSLCFAADSSLLASGDRDGRIQVYDLNAEQVRFTISFDNEIITSLSIDNGNKYLAAGTTGRQTVVINLVTGEIMAQFPRTKDVLTVRFNHDGKIMAAGGADKKIEIYSMESMSLINTLSHHRDWVGAMSFNNDGTRMVSGDHRGRVITWSVTGSSFRVLFNDKFSTQWITALQYLNDNRSFAASTSLGLVLVQIPFTRLSKRQRYLINDLVMLPNPAGKIIAVIASQGNGVFIMNSLEFKSKAA